MNTRNTSFRLTESIAAVVLYLLYNPALQIALTRVLS